MLKIYTFKDTKAHAHRTPWFQPSHGEAERFAMNIMGENEKDLPGYFRDIAKYPHDFEIYYHGDFDVTEGKIKTLDAPQHIINCSNLKKVGQ